MTQDNWEERYLALVPEKLTAADARVLLDLIEEDTERFLDALSTYAHPDDEVFCECAPDINPGCPLGDHAGGHLVRADWRVSEVGDYDAFSYYCTPCKEAFASCPAPASTGSKSSATRRVTRRRRRTPDVSVSRDRALRGSVS